MPVDVTPTKSGRRSARRAREAPGRRRRRRSSARLWAPPAPGLAVSGHVPPPRGSQDRASKRPCLPPPARSGCAPPSASPGERRPSRARTPAPARRAAAGRAGGARSAGRCAGILRERGDLAGERERGRERLALGDDAVREAHRERLVGADGRPVRIRSIARLIADQPRQPDRAAVDQRHAEAAAEHAEGRRPRGDAQVAPQRELEPAGDRVALDRGDHRLASSSRVGPIGPSRAVGVEVERRPRVRSPGAAPRAPSGRRRRRSGRCRR